LQAYPKAVSRSACHKHFDLLADQPDVVAKMRELVLELAVRGKLQHIVLPALETHWRRTLRMCWSVKIGR
jgi:hypothetical protein